VVVVTATVVSRTLDARSIYDARFTDNELKALPGKGRPASA